MPVSPALYIPQSANKRLWLVWFGLASGAACVMILIVAAPLALANNHGFLAFVIYKAFSKICHQLPERSFYIAGYPFAVCARCTGVYVGFTAVLFSYPFISSLRRTLAPAREWLVLAALPMAIDLALRSFGVWENTHASRFLTGALLGGVAVFYVMPGVADLALRGRRSMASHYRVPLGQPMRSALSAAPSDYSAPHRRI